jgi:hypothetical protein
VRRQLAHQCTYDEAEEPSRTRRGREPTAVHARPNEHNQTQTSQRTVDEHLLAPGHRSSEPLLSADVTTLISPAGLPGDFASLPSLDVSASSGQVGFLGSSSYSGIFDEINGSLDVSETEIVPGSAAYASPVSEDLVRKGADVLFHLRDIEIMDCLLQKWLVIGDGYLIFAPIYHTWMREIKEKLGPSLSRVFSPEDLRDMSIMLWRNTRMPVVVNRAITARDFAQHTAGQYLRWEVVGLLFSAVGIVSGSLNGRDVRLHHGRYTSAGHRKIPSGRCPNCHDHSVLPAEVLLANLTTGMAIFPADLVAHRLIKLSDTSDSNRGESTTLQPLH